MSGLIADSRKIEANSQRNVSAVIAVCVTVICGLSDGAEPIPFELKDVPTRCLALSPDGKQLAAGGADENGALIECFDTSRWQLTKRLVMRGECVMAMTFSSDSKLLFAGVDADIAVVDPAQNRELTRWARHQGYVYSIVRSPDGCYLATSGADGRICIWDAKKRAHARDLDRYAGSIFALAFDPSSRQLAAVGRDIFRVWPTLEKGRLEDVPFNDSAFDVHFSPKGDFVYAATDSGVLVQADLDSLSTRPKMFRVGSSLAGLAFLGNRDDSLLVGSGRFLTLCGVMKGSKPKPIHRGDSDIRGIASDATATRVAVATWGRTVKVWNQRDLLKLVEDRE